MKKTIFKDITKVFEGVVRNDVLPLDATAKDVSFTLDALEAMVDEDQPKVKADSSHLISIFRWQEIDAMERAEADIPVVNGKLDFTGYDQAMADIRAARAGMAVEL